MHRRLHMRPGEGSFVFSVGVLALFLALGRVLLLSVSNAEFLARFEADDYGWVYLLAAVCVATGGAVYRALIERVRYDQLVCRALLLLALVAALPAWFMGRTDVLVPLMPALSVVVWVFGLLFLWGLASRGVDEEQASRLFGLMGVGEVLGDVVGGLAVGPALGAFGPQPVLFAGAGFLACAGWLVLAISRWHPAVLEGEPAGEVHSSGAAGHLGPWRTYVRWFGALGATMTLCWYLVDASLYRQLAARNLTAAEVGSFLGLMWAGIAGSTFLVRLTLSGRVVSRFGVRGIVFMPAALLGLLLLVAFSSAAGWADGTFFGVAGTVVVWRVVRDGFDKPGALLLYQVMPPRPRLTAQSLVETLGDAGATALAGLLLLALSAAPGFGAGALAVVTAGLVVLWTALARRMITLHGALQPVPVAAEGQRSSAIGAGGPSCSACSRAPSSPGR